MSDGGTTSPPPDGAPPGEPPDGAGTAPAPGASGTANAPASDTPVALVTGARKGIGRHLAERFLDSGYRVVGCGRGDEGWARAGFEYRRCDVAEEPDVVALIRHIGKAHGRLDVVVNNAALASMNHTLLTPVTTLEKMLRANVTGTFLVSREAAKLMRKRKFGRIVNVSSAVLPLMLSGGGGYLASKSAVDTLSQVMARELAEFGITVNVVAPGPTATDMIRGVPDDKIRRVTDQFFNKRLTTLDDVWNTVAFFVHPESTAVTGQVIYLNGVPR